ncbi:MAG: Cell division protein FtsZ [Verrucomicrobia subdivision 3 bacterium]|nr:Cell division protein FtsZ [Limisphaerales bacterium]MCS1412392.1 Cell division protein FtsZ [Limisphaerales bacterium]
MDNESDFSAKEGRLSAKVIGVGDAGCRAADLLARDPLPGVDFLALNSDARGLQEMQSAKTIQLGRELLRGLSAGGDPELGRASAEADREPLTQCVDQTDLVIFLGGLGGGTASGALPVIARQAREAGALVLSFVSLPFELEGRQRAQQAELGLNQLLVASDAVISLPNQTFLEIVDECTRLPETFEIINRTIAQGVRGIWQMIEKSGLINVSFQDLRSVVQSKHAKSTFAVAEAEGKNRSREVVEALLTHPLLSGADQFEDADALLVNIVGGDSLSISEVDRIMERLRRQVGEARMIVGASTDPAMGEKVGLTLIASWHRKNHSVLLKIDAPHSDDFVFPVPIEGSEIETSFFKRSSEMSQSTSRFVAPPPESEDRQADRFFSQIPSSFTQRRRIKRQLKQGMLKLEVVSHGRFEKTAPTVYNGENLDTPTFVRRGIALN